MGGRSGGGDGTGGRSGGGDRRAERQGGDRRPPPAAGEHPGLQRDVAGHGRAGARRDQHRQLERARRRGREAVQDGQRPARQPERQDEHDAAEQVLAQQALATAHPEGHEPVGRGVADRRQRQGDPVGPGGTERTAEEQEEQRVGQRARDPDGHEARDRPGGGQPGDAAQVLQRRAQQRHARVGVVDPVDRHLVDAQPAPLGEHEQLGVEEPAVVADIGEQAGEHVPADRLEAALRVGEARAQDGPQAEVVPARDDLPAWPADHPRAVREPRADRQVAVSGEQRSDEWQQRPQVGREIDVHVAGHARRAGAPRRPQGASASLALEPQDRDAGELGGERAGEGRGRVGAGVVGDHDPPAERQLGRQEAVQPPDAALEAVRLVVDGHHHVDVERAVRPRPGRAGGGGAGTGRGGRGEHAPQPRPRRSELPGTRLRGA